MSNWLYKKEEIGDFSQFPNNTFGFIYKITTGDTEHPLYKGNNQIDLRLDILEEFGIPCLWYYTDICRA